MHKEQKKKNIKLLVIDQDVAAIGGAETLLNSLVLEFTKNGLVVNTVSNFSPFLRMQEELGAETVLTPTRMNVFGGLKGLFKFILQIPWAIIWYARLLRSFKESGGNLVLITGFSDKIVVSPLAHFIRLPVVWLEHSSLQPVFERNLKVPGAVYKWAIKYQSVIITPSNYSKGKLLTELGENVNIKVISNGIKLISNQDKDLIEKKKLAIKGRFAIPKNAFIIGSISRLETEKGQDELIKSIPYLKKDIKNILLVIAGEGDREKLKKIARETGVLKNVLFLGFVPEENKFELIACFNVFVFPTRWRLEGFGIILLEVMQMGIPIIGSNFGPVPEVVGDAGIIVDPYAESIANAVVKIYKNAGLRNKLSKKSVFRVKYFDIKFQAKKYISLFNQHVNKKYA